MQSFDSRFAAAESMCSFFTAIGGSQHAKSDSRVAGLVALYDALNDDDDEVRTVASRAASRILGRALVPPEAAVHLLSWLGDTFRASAHFRTLAVRRVVAGHGVGASTGKPCGDGCGGEEGVANPWAPAAEQLDVALRDDDSLFQQEKQNLFRDDVRETLNWLSVVAAQDLNQSSESQGEGKDDDDTLAAWDTWLRDGLARLIPLISDDAGDSPDAPLGWSNNQDALVVCGRIVHSAMYLAASGKASKELAALWDAFGAAAARAPGGGSMALERLRMAVTYAQDGVTMTSMET